MSANRSLWTVAVGGTVLVGLIVFGLNVISVETTNKPSGGSGSNTAGSFNNLIGQPAPDFSLQDYNGKTHKLADHRGQKVVLFFNEGIMCYPACWNQVASLGQDSRFQGGTVAMSIVIDSRNSWTSAVNKMSSLASATVLFDDSRSASEEYGVLSLPSPMHPGAYPGHTFVVIDTKGIIRYTYDDPRMALDNELIANELAKID